MQTPYKIGKITGENTYLAEVCTPQVIFEMVFLVDFADQIMLLKLTVQVFIHNVLIQTILNNRKHIKSIKG